MKHNHGWSPSPFSRLVRVGHQFLVGTVFVWQIGNKAHSRHSVGTPLYGKQLDSCLSAPGVQYRLNMPLSASLARCTQAKRRLPLSFTERHDRPRRASHMSGLFVSQMVFSVFSKLEMGAPIPVEPRGMLHTLVPARKPAQSKSDEHGPPSG